MHSVTNGVCQVDNLPCVLTDADQWVCWQPEDRNGKITKPPYSPSGGRASVADPETWSDFETARSASQERFDGRLGFVFTDEDNFAGMDIDDCRDPETGKITPKAQYMIATLNSYTEISPSGTGVHIIVRLDEQGEGKRGGGYEMYHHSRYFTVTGNRLEGIPDEVAWRDAEWKQVYRMAFPKVQTHALSVCEEKPALVAATTHREGQPTDEQVLEKASKSKSKDKFLRLYEDGDMKDYSGDHSTADLALCRILAFYCGPDGYDQIERLVSASALGKREKWEREDYRIATIQKAIDDQHEFYDWSGRSMSFVIDPQAVNDTEVGNAHRLHRQYGQDIRYISEFKKWAVWTGDLWRIGDADLVKRMALETVKGILHEAAEANGDRRQALIRHAYKSETARGVENMVSLTRLLDGVTMSAEGLDSKPWLLNVANGTVDLRTGTLREADRADMLTKQVPILFDADAKCPTFDAFLARVVPDVETRSFLKRAVGYSLTGVVREHALFFLYGSGKNGKSTFTSVIESLLGDMWTKTRSNVLMVSQSGAGQGATPELAQLKGKRLVTVTEISSGSRLDEALIKDMTGGDRISARSLYSEPFTYIPTHKVWMYGNHKPDIRGTDPGIWRRVNLIPFHEIITQEECDLALGDKLAAELPGILNWGLEGCLEWQMQGLGEPAEVIKATQEYRDEMDSISLFVAECCEAGMTYRIGSTALYEAYRQNCADLGEMYKSLKLFSQAIKEKGYNKGRMTDGKMTFEGLRLIPVAGALDKEAQD